MSDALNHAELSRDLALALGYRAQDIELTQQSIYGPRCLVRGAGEGAPMETAVLWDANLTLFDYRDPSVCLPLIKWLMVEHGAELWRGVWFAIRGFECLSADAPTLEEAVARAVIAVRKGE